MRQGVRSRLAALGPLLRLRVRPAQSWTRALIGTSAFLSMIATGVFPLARIFIGQAKARGTLRTSAGYAGGKRLR
jgi:hypothetical protein